MKYSLDNLFVEFCKYLEGKSKWSEKKRKPKEWTKTVFNFFIELNKEEDPQYIEKTEYMHIDYIWRSPIPPSSTNEIVLAVEHENEQKKINELIDEEVQHLVDIRAAYKIGIFYVSPADQKEFINGVKGEIQKRWLLKLQEEKYLIILGYSTTYQKKRVILFKGFVFNSNGELEIKKDGVVHQI